RLKLPRERRNQGIFRINTVSYYTFWLLAATLGLYATFFADQVVPPVGRRTSAIGRITDVIDEIRGSTLFEERCTMSLASGKRDVEPLLQDARGELLLATENSPFFEADLSHQVSQRRVVSRLLPRGGSLPVEIRPACELHDTTLWLIRNSTFARRSDDAVLSQPPDA